MATSGLHAHERRAASSASRAGDPPPVKRSRPRTLLTTAAHRRSGWWAAAAGIGLYALLAGLSASSSGQVGGAAGAATTVAVPGAAVAPAAAGALIYSLVLLTALVALAVRVRAMAAHRSAWALLAGGAGVLGLCQLVLVWAGVSTGPSAELAVASFRDHPQIALAGLLAYPLLYAGHMRMLKQHVQGVLPSAWLDGLLAALLLSAIACAYLVPLLREQLNLGLAAALALALRPLFDLLLALFAASCWGLAGRGADRRLPALAAAFALLTAADALGVARLTGLLGVLAAPVPHHLLDAAAHGSTGDSVLTSPGRALELAATALSPGALDVTGNVIANSARLLVLLVVVAAATPAPAVQSGQLVRWSSICGPAVVMLGALGLLWLNEHTPLGELAVLLALAALAGVGVKLVLLFREVLALADSHQLALSDDLTGLANRRALGLALSAALTGAAPGTVTAAAPVTALSTTARVHGGDERTLVALLLIDLDGFKAVNDRYGHTTGDALLRWTAARLKAVLPRTALLARLGGDEFAILLTGADATRAEAHARAAGAAIAMTDTESDPMIIRGAEPRVAALASPVEVTWPARLPHSARLAASIGMATLDGEDLQSANRAEAVLGARADAPRGIDDGAFLADTTEQSLSGSSTTGKDLGEELLRRADVAMYRAKGAGEQVCVYDPADDSAAQDKAQLLEELRTALAGGHVLPSSSDAATAQIVVHYQPQVDARTGHTVAAEALVRWRHPRLGLLAPAAFLDLAEENGLTAALTDHVLRTAVHDAAKWHAEGHPLRVAVNLSTSCLINPALLHLLDEVLTESGLRPNQLVMEITETTLMTDPERALATAHAIRQRGVQLSIDDYGTGYSSLAYLAALPATELKLDRAFTARLTQDPATAAIVASTVDLAHRLGLRLLAEGVEDAATLSALVAAGCDETQGYLHARPAPAAELTRRLQVERATRTTA